jgi:hypothetical protein
MRASENGHKLDDKPPTRLVRVAAGAALVRLSLRITTQLDCRLDEVWLRVICAAYEEAADTIGRLLSAHWGRRGEWGRAMTMRQLGVDAAPGVGPSARCQEHR